MALVKILLAAVAVVVFLVLRFVWSMHRKYKPLLRDDHFAELLALAPSLKQAALERVGEPLRPPDDPRVVLTSRGLLVFYSVQESAGGYLHHLSFSYGGGAMALAAGGRFMYVILTALGTFGGLKGMAHSRGGVTHGIFELSEVLEAEYATRAVVVPQKEDVPRLKDAATEWLNSFRTSGQLLQSEAGLLARVSAVKPAQDPDERAGDG